VDKIIPASGQEPPPGVTGYIVAQPVQDAEVTGWIVRVDDTPGTPKARSRQQAAFIKVMVATGLLLAIVFSGAAYHLATNPSFFVFRQTGAGSTGDNSPTDTQFLAKEHSHSGNPGNPSATTLAP
jgi:hypothetical protein